MGVHQRLGLQLNLRGRLRRRERRCITVTRAFAARVDNGLRLYIAERVYLAGRHGHELFILGGRHDGLGLSSRLHHGLRLSLDLRRRNVSLLTPGRRRFELCLELLLQLCLNLLLEFCGRRLLLGWWWLSCAFWRCGSC